MINIIGTIYDNSVQHTVALADQILDQSYKNGKKQNLINAELDERINSLNSQLNNNKGFFASFEDLQQKVSSPTVGDYAVVLNDNACAYAMCQQAGQWTLTEVQFEQQMPSLEGYVTQEDLQQSLASKQDKLVSGSNIVTINGNSLLRSGNIQVQGGDSGSGDGIKHAIITSAEYEALEEYDHDTIYFIIENGEWGFGDNFPIILNDYWAFGGAFPLTLL